MLVSSNHNPDAGIVQSCWYRPIIVRMLVSSNYAGIVLSDRVPPRRISHTYTFRGYACGVGGCQSLGVTAPSLLQHRQSTGDRLFCCVSMTCLDPKRPASYDRAVTEERGSFKLDMSQSNQPRVLDPPSLSNSLAIVPPPTDETDP